MVSKLGLINQESLAEQLMIGGRSCACWIILGVCYRCGQLYGFATKLPPPPVWPRQTLRPPQNVLPAPLKIFIIPKILGVAPKIFRNYGGSTNDLWFPINPGSRGHRDHKPASYITPRRSCKTIITLHVLWDVLPIWSWWTDHSSTASTDYLRENFNAKAATPLKCVSKGAPVRADNTRLLLLLGLVFLLPVPQNTLVQCLVPDL